MRVLKKYTLLPLAAAAAAALLLAPAAAAPFANGNLVTLRVGRGGGSSSVLTQAATAVFLDEFTPAGAAVQSIEIPGVRLSGTDGFTTGSMSRSADGASLVFPGVWAPEGAPAGCSTGGYGVSNLVGNSCFPNAPRAIVRVDAGGNIAVTNISSALYDGLIHGACTYDGTGYWIVGNATTTSAARGVAYVPHGQGSSTTSIHYTANDWYHGCSVGGPSGPVVGSPWGNTLYLVKSNINTYASGSGYAAYVTSPSAPAGVLYSSLPPPTSGSLPVCTTPGNCLPGQVINMNQGNGNFYLDRTWASTHAEPQPARSPRPVEPASNPLRNLPDVGNLLHRSTGRGLLLAVLDCCRHTVAHRVCVRLCFALLDADEHQPGRLQGRDDCGCPYGRPDVPLLPPEPDPGLRAAVVGR
jgi:hypothetical protein